MRYTQLLSRGLLRIGGRDARAFLQGLATVDVGTVSRGRTRYGAMLTPQGKFLHDFFIAAWEGGLLLETEAARVEELKARLLRYRLRQQVEVESPAAPAVWAAWEAGTVDALEAPGDTAPLGGGIAYADPRLAALGLRVIAPPQEAERWLKERGGAAAPEQEYHMHRIRLGVPEGSGEMPVERALPRHYGLDLLGGVDFAKGCYVGQEVTARSKHRAELGKFIYRVEAEGGALPVAGTAVERAGQAVGEIRASRGGVGLALLRVDAAGGPLMAAGAPLRACLPEWADGAEAVRGQAQ